MLLIGAYTYTNYDSADYNLKICIKETMTMGFQVQDHNKNFKWRAQFRGDSHFSYSSQRLRAKHN